MIPKLASRSQRPFREVYTAHASVAGRRARYRLLEGELKFFLEVGYRGERVVLPLGRSFARAAGVFESFWRGRVTPCTARDVLSDLLFALRE